MKRKVFLSMLCAFIMSTNILSTAFASEQNIVPLDIRQEIKNAQEGITDITITDELKKHIEATFTDNNGTVTPIEFDYTIKELGKVQSNLRAMDAGTLYSITVVTRASAKPHDSETRAYGVRAYGTVTWIDNLGTGNELTSISGGWVAVESGSKIVGDRSVRYGIYPTGTSGTADSDFKYLDPTTNTFSKSSLSMKGYKLGINTSAKVEDRNGNAGTLTLNCIPSVLSQLQLTLIKFGNRQVLLLGINMHLNSCLQ